MAKITEYDGELVDQNITDILINQEVRELANGINY